jgi:hypothetical protein
VLRRNLTVTDRVIFAATAACDEIGVLDKRMAWRMHATIVARLVVGTAAATGNCLLLLNQRMSGAFAFDVSLRIIGAVAGERRCSDAHAEGGYCECEFGFGEHIKSP